MHYMSWLVVDVSDLTELIVFAIREAKTLERPYTWAMYHDVVDNSLHVAIFINYEPLASVRRVNF